MGWTGGQYSLYRVALAILAGTTLASAAGALLRSGAAASPLAGSQALRAALLALAFLLAFGGVGLIAVGHRDRLAAGLLAPFLLFAELLVRSASPASASSWSDALAGRTALLPALLLALHARVPAAPFGSLDARGRIDPRGDWARPAVQTGIGWALLAVVFAARLVLARPALAPPAFTATTFELALALLGLLVRGRRPALWAALALFVIAHATAAGAPLAEAGLFCLLLLACEPTGWPGRSLVREVRDETDGREEPDARDERTVRDERDASDDRRPRDGHDERAERPGARLFYDGDCGFCHRSVRFILAEELATPARLRLRFAPLAGPTYQACLARQVELDPGSLPDSIVLEREDGRLLVRSAAALEVASRLGGFWRLLALAAGLLPARLLDAAYDGIARIRKSLFAAPEDACPILPPDLRARFDP